MNYDYIQETLSKLFEAEWADRTPIAWPNQTFDPQGNSSWVRFSFLPADAYREVIRGTPSTGQKITGLLVIQVFTPENTGSGESIRLVDAICGIFNEKETNGVVTFVPFANNLGGTGEGWFQQNVNIPFEYLS